jgi:hypothetical protein
MTDYIYECTSCPSGRTNDPGRKCRNCGSITWASKDSPETNWENRREPEEQIKDAYELLRSAAEDDRCPATPEVADLAGRTGELIARLGGADSLARDSSEASDD